MIGSNLLLYMSKIVANFRGFCLSMIYGRIDGGLKFVSLRPTGERNFLHCYSIDMGHGTDGRLNLL